MQTIESSKIGGLFEKLDVDFRKVFEDTGSLDCLEFLRCVGRLGRINSDNLFGYMKLFMQVRNGEKAEVHQRLQRNSKFILLEKKIVDEDDEWFVHCKLSDIEGPVIVNRGTRVKSLEAPSLQQSHKDLRNELMLSRILIRDGKKLIFSRNYEFNSLSAAASVICGATSDGWKVFKIAGTDQLASTLKQ
ncbi:DUF4357 domain-containing protein [Candidatus Pacearchaeota archaeon]|jgi:hypothetical protein|nr:DUF4357 domain-containing protein [Candidatus Pacearchaeota archaeon]